MKIISNFGNEIFVKAGYEGVSVVCEISSLCTNIKEAIYVTVNPNNNAPCEPFLRFSSNPMKKNNVINRVSIIDDDPCGPTEPLFFRTEVEKTSD